MYYHNLFSFSKKVKSLGSLPSIAKKVCQSLPADQMAILSANGQFELLDLPKASFHLKITLKKTRKSLKLKIQKSQRFICNHLLHLFHHALNALHPIDCPEYVRIHGLGHTLINFGPFCWVEVLELLLILEELLDPSHLNDLSQ